MSQEANLSLDQAYNLFKKALEGKNLAPATIIAYTTDVKQLVQFLQKEGIRNLGQVKDQHLLLFQKYLSKKGYSPISWARKLNALRRFFKFAQKKGLISKNPLTSFRSPKVEKYPPRILSKMEYRALRDTCRDNPRTAALVEIFLQTGTKVNEVANLCLGDIKKDRLLIRKNAIIQRETPLTLSAKKAIDRYLKFRPKTKCPNLFVTKHGTPLLIRNLSTLLARCFREAEIKNACLNSLRHTWIYHQLLAGLPLQLVAELAGHKRVSTTAGYLELINKKTSRVTTKLKEL